MDEARTLINVSISSMIAAMFVGAAVSLISFGYIMWTYFARQDSANNTMAYYSNFTAYDNQTITGSDVLGLLARADDYQIWVAFYDAVDTTPAVEIFDDVADVETSKDVDGKSYIYFDPSGYASYTKAYFPSYTNAIPVCEAAIQTTKTIIGDKLMKDLPDTDWHNLHGTEKIKLVELLTNSAAGGLGNLETGKENSYAAFKSTVIYAGDGSTDIIGVVLVRAHPHVTDFCQE